MLCVAFSLACRAGIAVQTGMPDQLYQRKSESADRQAQDEQEWIGATKQSAGGKGGDKGERQDIGEQETQRLLVDRDRVAPELPEGIVEDTQLDRGRPEGQATGERARGPG